MKRLNLRIANKQSSNLKLISSAIKSISEKGISETTMSDVSQGAGLSQGIVNFHFKSKELLLIETLKYISNEYLQSFQNCLEKSGSNPCKQIIAIINNDDPWAQKIFPELSCKTLSYGMKDNADLYPVNYNLSFDVIKGVLTGINLFDFDTEFFFIYFIKFNFVFF